MYDAPHTRQTLIPRHWIGVHKWWYLLSDNPLEHLIAVSPAELKTHALVIGATGSGKTNLLHHLVAQDLGIGHSLAALDLRGDFAAAILELSARVAEPEDVRFIDLRDPSPAFGFNPLAGDGEPYFRALNVLNVLATESESWGVQLSETLRNALLLLAENGEPLTRLEALLYDRDYRLTLMERCETETILSFWERFDELSPDKQQTLAMPVLNKVSLLLSTKTLRAILGHPKPMDLGAHLNRRGSVLLASLAVDELHGAGLMMGRLLLASICREIFARVRVGEQQRNPVRLYVDEFEHFGMGEFETILAEGRRFGLGLILAHQTLAQLTPRMRSMILNNVGAKFVFRCGREDGATLSRDLSGDARAYDFTIFERGEALLWRRDQGFLDIEINEPIVSNVGSQSQEARAFLADVARQGTPYREEVPKRRPTPRVEPAPSPPPKTAIPKAPKPPKVKFSGTSEEDWLCN